jgi:pyruvate carboxylase
MYVVTVTVNGQSRTRRVEDEDAALAAVDRRIEQLRAQGYERHGGHPVAGSIVTAHLRPTDRRRRATAVITAEPVS